MRIYCFAGLLLLAAGPILAQDGSPLKITGSYRTRAEAWNWFPGEGDNRYLFLGNIIKLNLTRDHKTWEWQFELAAPFLLGLPSNAIAPAPQLQLGLGGIYAGANDRRNNAAMVFPKQAWVRWKALGGDERQSLKLGRLEFNDATEVTPKNATLAALKRLRIGHRLIGTFPWTHVGRSFDGADYRFNSGRNHVALVGAMPTRGAFQVDGWGRMNIGFGHGSYTRQTGSGDSVGELRLLGITYHDWRGVLKTDSRPVAARRADTGAIRLFTYGGHYIHTAPTAAGAWDVMLWGMGQTGEWGALAHRAWSTDFEFGFQPKGMAAVKPWLRLGYTRSSGDDDPNDGTHRTFFQMLPTPRPFAMTPFFNMMNSEDAYATLILRPHKQWTLRGEAHILSLSSRQDLWYQGGGAFQPWTFGYVGRPSGGARRLANLYDLSVDYTVNNNWALHAYIGFTDGRAVVRNIYPKGDNATFGYLESTWRW